MSKHRIALIVLTIVLWLIIDVVITFIVPVFAAMFADFGAQLPFPTRFLIALAATAKTHWYVYRPFFTGSLVAAAVAVVQTKKRKHVIWFFLSSALTILLLVVALFLPIFQLGSVTGGLQK